MSNYGQPALPAPAGWQIPANVPLTQEAVKQFESVLDINWTQIRNLPGNLSGNEARMVTLENKAGRIFSPTNYGAVGDGVTDDGPAIRACLVAARAWAGIPAVTNYSDPKFRIPVIDFGGLCYATNQQIEVPGGFGMTLQNGVLKAGSGFTSGMYLLRAGSLSDAAMLDGFRIVNATFRNLYFDNNHVGGGLLLENFMRLSVDRCIFAHYQTEGLKTTNTGSHELIISNSQWGEYWWNDPMAAGTAHAGLPSQNYANEYVGTGVFLDSNDNHMYGCVIQLSKYGLIVGRAANHFNQIHIWTGYVKTVGTVAGPLATLDYMSTGLWIKAAGQGCTFNQMYMDGCEVLWEEPWKTSFTNSQFLQGWGDANRAFIRFQPIGSGQFIDGVNISGNRFEIVNGGAMKMSVVDTSLGTFNTGQITRCHVENNNFTGVITPQYTRVKTYLSQSAASTWSFDLTGMLIWSGAIQQVLWSVFHWGGGSQLFRMTAQSGFTITFNSYAVATPTTLSANNATVYIDVTCVKPF
jgi:hypothetical protein